MSTFGVILAWRIRVVVSSLCKLSERHLCVFVGNRSQVIVRLSDSYVYLKFIARTFDFYFEDDTISTLFPIFPHLTFLYFSKPSFALAKK